MVFRRRRETDDVSDLDDQGDLEEIDAGDDDREPAAVPDIEYAVKARVRPTGPWDFEDMPKDDDVPRVDLGALIVPVFEGIELRVEVQDEIPVAAMLVHGNSQLQVHAFAAPKSSGLWHEVRTEIAQSLGGAGGSAEHAEGPFGTELQARLPMEGGGTQSARFIGTDGPRWFLRGLLTGPGSTDATQAKVLEEAFRQIVVNRGTDAMAPRDMLPLHLPREAFEAGPRPPDDETIEEPDRSLQLPERGPEITEIQ